MFHSAKFHLVMTFAWILIGGTLTYFFPDSVAWVALMSLYANIVGHWSAYQAARLDK